MQIFLRASSNFRSKRCSPFSAVSHSKHHVLSYTRGRKEGEGLLTPVISRCLAQTNSHNRVTVTYFELASVDSLEVTSSIVKFFR